MLSYLIQPSAHALPCLNPHCYSIGAHDSVPGAYTGGYIDEHANFMTQGEGSPPGRFINSEMWIYPADISTLWVEAGLTNGIVDGSPICYCAFWAQLALGGAYHERLIEYLTPNGTTQKFQISRGPYIDYWNIYYNDSYVGLTWDSGFWTNSGIEVGAELFSDSGNARADTFDINIRVFDGAGNPLAVSTYNKHRDYACPQNGCFNGLATWSAWHWNKQQG